MASNPPGAAPAVKTGSRWAAVLTGCAIGCGAFLVLLIVIGVLMVRWATEAVPLPAEGALLHPSVSGALVATLAAEDEAALAFLEQFERSDRSDPHILPKALPVRFEAVLMGSPEAPAYVGVLSLSRYANLVRLPFKLISLAGRSGKPGAEAVLPYRDESILIDPSRHPRHAFASVGGSFVLASAEEQAHFAIDRLKDRDGGQLSAELEAVWPRASKAAVKGAALNRAGELVRLVEWLDLRQPGGPEAAADPVHQAVARARAVVVELKLGTPDASAVSGVVELIYAEDAASAGQALQAVIPLLEARLKEREIDPRVQIAVEGERVRIDLRLGGLAEALAGRGIRYGPIEVK